MAAYRRVMTHVTCRLTAKNRDDPRNTMLGNRVWATFTFFICMLFYRRVIVVVWGYSCRSGIPRALVSRMLLISYVLNADSGR